MWAAARRGRRTSPRVAAGSVRHHRHAQPVRGPDRRPARFLRPVRPADERRGDLRGPHRSLRGDPWCCRPPDRCHGLMHRLIIGAFAVTAAVAGCAPTPEAVQPLTGTTAASATTADPPAATAADPPATTPAPPNESPEPPAPASPPADSGDAAVSGPASDASGEVAGEPTETDRASELADGSPQRWTAGRSASSTRQGRRQAQGRDPGFFDGMRLWAQYGRGSTHSLSGRSAPSCTALRGAVRRSEVTLYFAIPGSPDPAQPTALPGGRFQNRGDLGV